MTLLSVLALPRDVSFTRTQGSAVWLTSVVPSELFRVPGMGERQSKVSGGSRGPELHIPGSKVLSRPRRVEVLASRNTPLVVRPVFSETAGRGFTQGP